MWHTGSLQGSSEYVDGPFCKSQITTNLMGHLAGLQNFLSEKVLLQCKWLILFYIKILANKALEEKLEAEVTQVDQKVVLELDQLVSDQQATLQVRIVPLFFCFYEMSTFFLI